MYNCNWEKKLLYTCVALYACVHGQEGYTAAAYAWFNIVLLEAKSIFIVHMCFCPAVDTGDW